MSNGQLPMSWPGQQAPGGVHPDGQMVPGLPMPNPGGAVLTAPAFFGSTPPAWTGASAADALAAAQQQQGPPFVPTGVTTSPNPVVATSEAMAERDKAEAELKKKQKAIEKKMRRLWATPQDRFSGWMAEFGFTLDGAASANNTKVPGRWLGPDSPFGSAYTDALSVKALPGEMLWLNAPGFDDAYVKWCWELMGHQDPRGRPRGIVQIRPANQTEQPFWQEYVEQYRDLNGQAMLAPLGIDFRIRFLTPRVEFIPPPPMTEDGVTVTVKESGPRSGHVLLIWRNLWAQQQTQQG